MTIIHLELEPWHIHVGHRGDGSGRSQSQLSQHTDSWYVHGTCGIAVLRGDTSGGSRIS